MSLPVAAGVSIIEPESGCVPLQAPEALQLVALVTVQLSVAELPMLTVVGLRLSVTSGADGIAARALCASMNP